MHPLQSVRRLVVKVGSSSLTHRTGKLNLGQLERLVRELADLVNQGKEVVLVTSGAIGAGMGRMGFTKRPKTMPEKQAAAAVGQGLLMHMYEKLFSEYGYTVGQVLLTREDVADRKRYLNARNTLITLLQYQVIPIVNENDTVVVEEIRVGDNDTLAALVAGLVDAELLVLLSDIDGLFTGDPRLDPDAVVIPELEEITPEIERLAGGAGSTLGTGGMGTKIHAAKMAMSSGIPMVIANGSREGALRRLLAGEPVGTLFLPRENRLHTKQRWIAFGSAVQGSVRVDGGAAEALLAAGKSLLPIGVVKVEGTFEPGNVVSILSPSGEEIARGITNYSAEEVRRIQGKKTDEIAGILGYKDYDEVIHRNNLVVTSD
ncbi:gamma-glutamyl kinase [Clostridiales bacterium PH28_bin88]|nr:gamma-glutamyl kinase [Clostridiales bacterium PH28_bin88]